MTSTALQMMCPDCGGTGEIEHPTNCGGPLPYAVTPEYDVQTCDLCDGLGSIQAATCSECGEESTELRVTESGEYAYCSKCAVECCDEEELK